MGGQLILFQQGLFVRNTVILKTSFGIVSSSVYVEFHEPKSHKVLTESWKVFLKKHLECQTAFLSLLDVVLRNGSGMMIFQDVLKTF